MWLEVTAVLASQGTSSVWMAEHARLWRGQPMRLLPLVQVRCMFSKWVGSDHDSCLIVEQLYECA